MPNLRPFIRPPKGKPDICPASPSDALIVQTASPRGQEFRAFLRRQVAAVHRPLEVREGLEPMVARHPRVGLNAGGVVAHGVESGNGTGLVRFVHIHIRIYQHAAEGPVGGHLAEDGVEGRGDDGGHETGRFAEVLVHALLAHLIVMPDLVQQVLPVDAGGRDAVLLLSP